MELWQEMLTHKRKQGNRINIETELTEFLSSECYKALKQIKEIIEDDSLEDSDCFSKIERIVVTFEGLGSNGGSRHDFG